MRLGSVIFIWLGFAVHAKCQRIDHLSSSQNINHPSYFRFNYDNDLFTSSDHNYTQGFSLEISHPVFRFNPLNYLFFKPKETLVRYGLILEHNSFTPFDYELEPIQFDDRPFAASIQMQSFSIATDSLRAVRLVSSLNIGVIGSYALGDEIQTAIHKMTGDLIPQGWQHQVKNDLILNYHLGLEKRLYRYQDLFSFKVGAEVDLGTYLTRMAIACNTSFGIINSPFSVKENRTHLIYLFAKPAIHLIGYDATFQGGLFNRSSPHVMSFNELSLLKGQITVGFITQLKKFYFEYGISFLTKEFKNGAPSSWGGFKLGFSF